MQSTTKTRPVLDKNYPTKKTTYAAKLETLRRKSVRSEKYGK